MREKAKPAPAPAPAASTPSPAPAPAKRSKLSYKDQRELDGLPARIEALEAEQKALGELLGGVEIYQGDPARLAEVQKRYAALDDELLAAMERWEELSSK